MENSLRMAWQLTLKEISEGCNNPENNEGCDNKNFVMSPMSIINALSILAFGSRGRTLEQLLDFLEAKDMDDLKAKVSLMLSAGAPVENTNTNTTEGLILSSLNGVWIDQRFPMKPSFKEIGETLFRAETNTVDFVNEAEIVTNKVNLWAKNATNGLIEKVLPPDTIDHKTVFILANALYFKGAWLNAFDAKLTRHKYFYPHDGEPIQVPFMNGDTQEKHFYGCFKDFKVLKIPYHGGQDNRQFSMYVFLPNMIDGLQDLIQKFNSTPKLLDNCFKLKEVYLSKMLIPKFKYSYEFEASEIIKHLELTLPFDKMVADFTEMIDYSLESDKVFVSKIFQKSCIEVNEEGTEAAAVTSCVSAYTFYSVSHPPPRPSFVANHPFIFMVREEISGIIFFVGVVLNPLLG